MDCCPPPDDSIPRLSLFTRTQIVEGFLDNDGRFMMIREIPPVKVASDPTLCLESYPPINNSFFSPIPKDAFEANFSPIQGRSTSEIIMEMTEQSVVDFLMLPNFDSSGMGFASQEEVTYESLKERVGDRLIERVKAAVETFKNFITKDMLIRAARLAYDTAIAALPFQVPSTIKEGVWKLIEETIRGIEVNPA